MHDCASLQLTNLTLWGHIPAGHSGDAGIEVFLARIDDE
jgi:hypothetical protein